MIPIIDLFAGPGGLGEGFSSQRNRHGNRIFRIALSIEKDPSAHQTLRLRSFYRQFLDDAVPAEYYAVLRGEASWETLRAKHQRNAENADAEAWNAELGVVSRSELSGRITNALAGAQRWVLIGGPPCQAYSLVGRSRRKGIAAYRPDDDARNTLYLHYLQVIADHSPSIFVMENVKGILSHKYLDSPIFDRILRDLKNPSRALGASSKQAHNYRVVSLVCPSSEDSTCPSDYIVKCESFGIPQRRHRVILLGIRDDFRGVLPCPLTSVPEVPASLVLGDLPKLRSGLSRELDSPEKWETVLRDSAKRSWFRGVHKAAGDEVEELIKKVSRTIKAPEVGRGAPFLRVPAKSGYMPEWFNDDLLNGISGHCTRSHMRQDLFRYLYCSCFAAQKNDSPKLKEFPVGLLPKHLNINREDVDGTPFKDRFRVQLWGAPATTVTSHIAKDGHYYIHPDPSQCRSLTVREAARLQTFPDSYHFLGNRTSQYTQVGNAVPPLLAKQIAERVARLLNE